MPKLTPNEVKEIKRLFDLKEQGMKKAEEILAHGKRLLTEAQKLTHQRIGEEYGVSKAAIQKIKDGDNWVNI